MTDVFAWTFPAGRVKIVSESEANADTSVSIDLRPGADKVWLVMEAWAYHNDTGAGRNIQWKFYDGTTTISRKKKSVAANAYVAIRYEASYAAAAASSILILSRDCYAQCEVDNFLTGETYSLYVNALVLEIDV